METDSFHFLLSKGIKYQARNIKWRFESHSPHYLHRSKLRGHFPSHYMRSAKLRLEIALEELKRLLDHMEWVE